MKGSPSLSPPRSQGKGTGGGFPNTSMVFGEGESFFKQFNGFRGQGEAKWINGFSRFSKVNPGCPRSIFLAFFKQKYTLMSWNLVFFQQYHYCKLHSRSCCKCRSCQVDKIVKIRLLEYIEWRGPLPCPRPSNRGRGRGEVFQTLQWTIYSATTFLHFSSKVAAD